MISTGDMAPDFDLPLTLPAQDAAGAAQSGGRLRLSSLRGDWVVLYFYPRDSTPACTLQGQDFTALLPRFTALGAQVIGISKDSPRRHENFCRKAGLGVALVSDAESDVSERYGVWQQKRLAAHIYMGIVRSSFLIDPEGRVRQVWSPANSRTNAGEMLAALEALTGQ